MGGFLRRLKGVLGIGVIWSGVAAAATSIVAIGGALLGQLLWIDVVGIGAAGMGFGLVLGCAFATVLTLLEGRRAFDELSTRRAAVWGGLVGAAAPVGLALVVSPLVGWAPFLDPALLLSLVSGSVAYGGVCAALAAGTLALARRAPAEFEPPDDDLRLSGPASRG